MFDRKNEGERIPEWHALAHAARGEAVFESRCAASDNASALESPEDDPSRGTRLVQQKSKVSILFADVCGSTPLYTVAGDANALSLIGNRLDSMTCIIEQEGGRVIRSKGDDLLCSFDDPDGAARASQRLVGEPAHYNRRVSIAFEQVGIDEVDVRETGL